jgi:hypothetical protein
VFAGLKKSPLLLLHGVRFETKNFKACHLSHFDFGFGLGNGFVV